MYLILMMKAPPGRQCIPFRRALNPVMSKQQNNRACFSELLPSSIPNPSHMNMRNSVVGRALGDSICVMCWSRW